MGTIGQLGRVGVVLALLLQIGCGGGGESVADEIDRNLVGQWRHTRAVSGFVSEVYSHLKADGTFVFSGQALGRSPNVSAAAGPTTMGRWKAEGGRLYSKVEGSGDWVDLGGYGISGDSLVLTSPDGVKTYWER